MATGTSRLHLRLSFLSRRSPPSIVNRLCFRTSTPTTAPICSWGASGGTPRPALANKTAPSSSSRPGGRLDRRHRHPAADQRGFTGAPAAGDISGRGTDLFISNGYLRRCRRQHAAQHRGRKVHADKRHHSGGPNEILDTDTGHPLRQPRRSPTSTATDSRISSGRQPRRLHQAPSHDDPLEPCRRFRQQRHDGAPAAWHLHEHAYGSRGPGR